MYEYEIFYYYDNQLESNRGLVSGVTSMYEATQKLLDYYGEEDVAEIHMKFVSDQPNIAVYKKNVTSLAEFFDVV